MIYTLSEMYIVAFIIYAIFNKKLHISRKQFIVFWGLYALSFSIVTFNMRPQINWDIVRHFEYLNQIRGSGISLFDLLFNNVNSIGSDYYKFTYSFNILRYFVANTFDNNYYLPAIFTFLNYAIWGYIVFDWFSSNYGACKVDIFTILLSFSFSSLASIASGLRNALAASIMGLAVYLYLYKNKQIVVLIFLALIAVTIHPCVLIAIPFVLLIKINISTIGYIFVFVLPVVSATISQIFMNSNISFLVYIGTLYYRYTVESDTYSVNLSWYSKILNAMFLVIFLIIYFVFHRKSSALKKNKSSKNLYKFLVMYMLYILGNIGYVETFSRPFLMFGSLAPVLSSFYTDSQIQLNKEEITKWDRIMTLCIKIAILVLCAGSMYMFFRYYWNVFFH